jgi:protein tyrosine phosphatase (PTP) superfamily phosphohydrolase (DUF442 family)
MATPFDAAAGIANRCQVLPTVLTGGQPSAAHLEALKAAGVSVILDLRDPMEPRPVDEPELIGRLGMKYVNVPVRSGALDDETLEVILKALRDNASRQVFVHCGSGNRVGGALIPYLILDAGMAEEDAVSAAMRVGLRSAELMEWGLDYVRRKSD